MISEIVIENTSTLKAAVATMTLCHLLSLPSELRIKIYEQVLTFSGPVKLRQVVRGSENTTLLRVNHQIHNEALSVFFEVNQIAATRNDFCTKTDGSMKTPVKGDHIRHLLVTNFGESIACNFLLDRCDVCEHHAEGFVEALKMMPHLKTVVVNYHAQVAKFRRFSEALSQSNGGPELDCVAVGKYALRSPSMVRVDVTFQYLPLARIWPVLITLSDSMPSEALEEDVLAELRKIHGDLPDKLWLLICAKRYGVLEQFSGQAAKTWVDDDLVGRKSDIETSASLHAFNDVLLDFLGRETAPRCRRHLRSIRELRVG